MTMAFLDMGRAVNLGNFGPFAERGVIGPKAHGAAFVITNLAFDLVVALHPFLKVIDHRLKPFLAASNKSKSSEIPKNTGLLRSVVVPRAVRDLLYVGV